MSARSLVVSLGILACCLFGLPARATDPIKIRASGCLLEPRERALSGFVLSSTHGIVTALHGVADCRLIIAMQPAKNISLEMRVAQQSVSQDLALLDTTSAPDRPKLQRITPFHGIDFKNIETGSDAQVIGFPHGVLTPQTHDVKIGYPKVERLGNIIGTGNLDLIERKSPDIELPVIKISGLVVNGESGAPVVLQASTGEVFGVVIGSTAPGASNIGWVVPIAPIKWTPYSISHWQDKPLPSALANAVGVAQSSGSHKYQLILSTPGRPDVRISLALGQYEPAVERLTPPVDNTDGVQQMVTIIDDATGAVVGSAPLGSSVNFVGSADSSVHEISTASAARRAAIGIIVVPKPPSDVRVN